MEPNHPPFAAGSITIPRQLYRWLDKNYQGGALTPTMTYIVLPAFTQAATWNGYSTIVASFNFEATNNFSLTTASGFGGNPNYTLCISYRVGGTLTRYIIWQGTGTVMNISIPNYNGQMIMQNFRLEIWSTSQGNASQATPVNFFTSVAGQLDYRYGVDGQLVGNDGEVTNFADQAVMIPQRIGITGAGDALLNQTFNLDLFFVDITGHPRYVSADGNYKIEWFKGGPPNFTYNWSIMPVGGLYNSAYWTSKTNVPNPVGLTWTQGTGTNPAPTLTDATFILPDTGFYLLPLIFPANAVSTTN